jgi:predicted RNase H-like nuclease (RuvC/YqgF family)
MNDSFCEKCKARGRELEERVAQLEQQVDSFLEEVKYLERECREMGRENSALQAEVQEVSQW